MKKVVIIFIIGFMFSFSGFGQEEVYKKISWFSFDNDLIESVHDSLKSLGFNEIIILHTDHLLGPIDSKEKEDSVLTIIVWHDKKYSYLKMISVDKVYAVERVQDVSIFEYKQKFLTGARKSELKDLKFLPPGTGPNAMFYYNTNVEFYFEKLYNDGDSPMVYNPDKRYEKYRDEWFDQIIDFLKDNFKEKKIESNYDRYKNY